MKALGKGYSEGSLSPYMKFTYTQSGIELQADNAVKAIFLSKKTDLATPRGIQVGNTAEDLRKAFGEPQVSSKGGNEIWAYESTGDGFGLFFWLKAKRVEVIGLLAADYQFRPTK